VGSIGEIVPAGFRLEAHEVVLYGACPDCADA
jgi:Fe2+ or Zn2+ uptake regulation protein